LPFAIQILPRVIVEDRTSLEEAVELGVRREAKEAAQFWMGQPVGAVFLCRDGFERPARQIIRLAPPGG
jgi:hypothetical protein